MTRRTRPATSTDDALTPLNIADDATTVLASRPSSDERTLDDDSGWSVVGSRKVDASGDATLAARAAVTEARVADDASKEWAVRCHEPMRAWALRMSAPPSAAATSWPAFSAPPRLGCCLGITEVQIK